MNAPKLRHRNEFKKILADYHVSASGQAMLKNLELVLMAAPTSTGRNTIIRHLIKSGEYYFIVSDTTRRPQIRDGELEKDGVNYYFRTEEAILADLKAGEFLEAAVIHDQQVSGISIKELNKAARQSKVAITDIDIVGTDNIMHVKPDTKAIFLLPPSFEEWQRRLNARGKLTTVEISNRLLGADREFKAAIDRDYYNYIVAEDIKQTAEIVNALVRGEPNPHQARGRELIRQLHAQLVAVIH